MSTKLPRSPEKGPQDEPTSWDLSLGFPNLQNGKKGNFCCLSHLLYGILLQQPEMTNTEAQKIFKNQTTKSQAHLQVFLFNWSGSQGILF